MDVPRTPPGPGLTGRYLVLCRDAGDAGVPKMLRDKAGLTMASSSDFTSSAIDPRTLGGADGIYLEQLGVAVTAAAPQQLAPMMNAPGAGGIVAVEPERYVYAFHIPRSSYAPLTLPASALGHTSTAGALVCALTDALDEDASGINDEAALTWGLTTTRVAASPLTGRGVRVAVLDTGLALDHPDFSGRRVVSHSFVEGEEVQDENSHGTHCAGTVLGSSRELPRYGIAPGADLYVGKVLGNSGRGVSGGPLAGIEWAIQNGCTIISMSLGSDVQRGEPYSQIHETVARRALAKNALIIAAAGNESRRPDLIAPVGSPANCPSVLSVGAVDSRMQIAPFSTRGMDANGGGIDLVAPGVDVYSTVPLPKRYGRKAGTSMACPHVAGIAALYAEANPRATARELWQLLVRNARKLDGDPADFGAGLVQAPA